MTKNAKSPEGVREKIRECRFFLNLMADYDQNLETEKFLHCLSAYLGAFRAIAYRLYGVVENQNGHVAKHTIMKRIHDHPDIAFVIGRSNVEMHEDGARVWQFATIHLMHSVPRRWESPYHGNASRFRSRFNWESVSIGEPLNWKFEESPKNLLQLCNDALTAIEAHSRDALAMLVDEA